MCEGADDVEISLCVCMCRSVFLLQESEDGILSSGDGVATEGEEEEEDVSPMRHSMTKGDEEQEMPHSIVEDAAEGNEQLTPYVAKCYGHLETLRKRKREQEEQVETLVEGAGCLPSVRGLGAYLQS